MKSSLNWSRSLIRLLLTTSLIISAWTHLPAQTEITSPVIVHLEKVTVGSGDNSYEKLGIWASLGDSNVPGLFEFDTGGAGFYAAINSSTPWWNQNSLDPEHTFTYQYASGFVYQGYVAKTSVKLFDSGTAIAPQVITGHTVHVGQTTQITDSHTSTTLWDSDTQLSQPPIDQSFFGDFGLSLQSSSSNIVNVIAQLSYGPNVSAGFIVHAGAHGVMNDSHIQIGLTPEDMTTFPIMFKLTGSGGFFPDTTLPYYPLQLIKGTITLNDDAYEQTEIGLTFDTGNQTPVIFDGSVPTDLLDGDRLKDGVLLSITANSETSLTTILEFIAENIEGVNKVDVQTPVDPTNLSVNLGLTVFEKYDVLFDIENGYLGLRPIPEPSTWTLLIATLLALLIIERRLRKFIKR